MMLKTAVVVLVVLLASVSTAMTAKRPLPTQCQLASSVNSQFKCDKNGLFQRKQTVDGVTKCVVPETGKAIPAKVGEDVDCEVMSACQKFFVDLVLEEYNHPLVEIADMPTAGCLESTGDYPSLRCPLFMPCACVNPKTGNIISGMEMALRDPSYCEESKYSSCQKDFIAIDTRNYENNSDEPLPVCAPHGLNFIELLEYEEPDTEPLWSSMYDEAPAGN